MNEDMQNFEKELNNLPKLSGRDINQWVCKQGTDGTLASGIMAVYNFGVKAGRALERMRMLSYVKSFPRSFEFLRKSA